MKKQTGFSLLALCLLVSGCTVESEGQKISADTLSELIHKPQISIVLEDKKLPACGADLDTLDSSLWIEIDQPLTETTSLLIRTELERDNGKWLLKDAAWNTWQPTDADENLNWQAINIHVWQSIHKEENKDLMLVVSFQEGDLPENMNGGYFISKDYTINIEKLLACQNPLTFQQLGQEFNLGVKQYNPYNLPEYLTIGE